MYDFFYIIIIVNTEKSKRNLWKSILSRQVILIIILPVNSMPCDSLVKVIELKKGNYIDQKHVLLEVFLTCSDMITRWLFSGVLCSW